MKIAIAIASRLKVNCINQYDADTRLKVDLKS